MPVYRDEAVVLRTHKLGEADRIVTLLTREHGKVRAVAKGVRRTASKFGSRLEPFMVTDVQLYVGRSLDIVQQAETLGSYGADIVSDYDRYTAASAMVETADRLTDAEASIQQYLLLVGGLRALARDEHDPELIANSYLLRAVAIAGWSPTFGQCARCGAPGPHSAVVPQLGGVVCSQCAPQGAAQPGPEAIGLLNALLTGDWAVADASGTAARAQASGIVSAYVQWHLERSVRSFTHRSRRSTAHAKGSDG